MKKYTVKTIRHAYAAPETTCVQLVTESVMQAASPLRNVTTQGYVIDPEEEDGWM